MPRGPLTHNTGVRNEFEEGAEGGNKKGVRDNRMHGRDASMGIHNMEGSEEEFGESRLLGENSQDSGSGRAVRITNSGGC